MIYDKALVLTRVLKNKMLWGLQSMGNLGKLPRFVDFTKERQSF